MFYMVSGMDQILDFIIKWFIAMPIAILISAGIIAFAYMYICAIFIDIRRLLSSDTTAKHSR